MEATYKPKALTPGELQALSQEVKQALTELYGDRLGRVILYGSYARGDFHAESDVDYIAVLTDDQFHQADEFDKHWELIWGAWNTYGAKVSIKVIFKGKFFSSDLFCYRNARREGVAV